MVASAKERQSATGAAGMRKHRGKRAKTAFGRLMQDERNGISKGNKVLKRPHRKKRRKKQQKRPKYAVYMRSKSWRAKRRQALDYHGHECNRCGSTHLLRVHHLTYVRLGHEKMRDLEVLCEDCHFVEHEDRLALQDSLGQEFAAIVG